MSPGEPQDMRKTMHKEDRILLAVICIALTACFILICLVMRWLMQLAGGLDEGIAFSTALLIGSGTAAIMLIVFALVAGDGLFGELPTMLSSYFAMSAWFTLIAAWIL